MRLKTPGGGGYGKPIKKIDSVLNDVKLEYISSAWRVLSMVLS